MKFGDLVKSLVSLYITIWLLILKKIKDVYQLEGPNINFGIFLKVFYRSGEKPKRSISMPTIHRSTSIRERRRNKSDPLIRSSKIYDSYSTQNFSLRRKTSWDDIERAPSAAANSTSVPQNNEIGKMKIKCKKSLMMARELREDKTALEQQLHKSDDEKISTAASSPPSPSVDDLPMDSLKLFKQRAFTFPNLKNLGGGRIRTVSERAEEKDQVMPLPVFPKNRRKSCVPPSTSSPTATASSGTPGTAGGPTGTKSPTCPSSPKNSSRRIVVHHQKKKLASENNNSWHKLQKSSKESDFLKNHHNHNAVIVKVAHR